MSEEINSNGVKTSEDAEMAECDGEKVVTMMEVLQEQEAFEEDANAVLGASDDKNCTYVKGYVKRQAVYACLTCCPDAATDRNKRAGVCLACSLTCHENHELVELYTKRNFRCDCGNPKFTQPCQFTPNKTDLNYENKYNQNFSGIYCTCQRPYPDPEATEEEEMLQCIVCEDWLHTKHLEATVPDNELYAEMICKDCMEDNDFLHDYSDIVVNVADKEIIVTDPDLDVSNFIKEKMKAESLTNGVTTSIENKETETDMNIPDSVSNKTAAEDVDMTEGKTDGSGDNVASNNESGNKTVGDAVLDSVSEAEAQAGDKKKDITGDKTEVESNTKSTETDMKSSKPEEPSNNKNEDKTKESSEPSNNLTSEAEIDCATKDKELETNGDTEKEAEVDSAIKDKELETNGDTEKEAEVDSAIKDKELETNRDTEKEAEVDSAIKDKELETNGDTEKEAEVDSATKETNGDTEKEVTNEVIQSTTDAKRKLSTDDVTENSSPKKQKLDTNPCVRPKGVKRVYNGATFWPSNFRQKLCTCTECLAMYKDLAVLYLIDPEDTVTAYEALGKEKTDGTLSSQYEKGLQALSSLDRVQQINALTEYNKMRDKLLEFLKSFKERKEIVKEEDIKAFFAKMKPKRQPDGVYFCR